MADDFRVMTPDLYGHGRGPDWHGAPSDVVAADAGRVVRMMQDCPGPVHLVGHSYGGAIALRVALNHPAKVASVSVYEPVVLRVLVDHNVRHRAAAEIIEVARDLRRDLNGGYNERAASRFVQYWGGPGYWSKLTPGQRANVGTRMPVVYAHFVALLGDAIRLRRFTELRAPVLFLAGRQTRASTRRITELMRYALPHVESMTMEGMGHLGPITHADRVNEPLAAFIVMASKRPPVDDRKAA